MLTSDWTGVQPPCWYSSPWTPPSLECSPRSGRWPFSPPRLYSLWANCTPYFLCSRMPRMVLMMVLFPLLSLLLAAWMTIFGFYLRLEEKQWQRWTSKLIPKCLSAIFFSACSVLFYYCILLDRIRRKEKKARLEKLLTSEWVRILSSSWRSRNFQIVP